MKSSTGTAVRPALIALLLLGATACGPSAASAPQAASAPGGPAATATTGAATGAAGAPSGGAPRANAATPNGAPPATAKPAAAGTVNVAPAKPGVEQAVVGTPGPGGAAVAPAAKDLKLAAYDPASGTAVLAAAPQNATPAPAATGTPAPGGSPSATPAPATATPAPAGTSAAPTPSASGSPADGAVKPGQLIASPPTAAAPQGALVAVTAVKAGAPGTVDVQTRPATVSELLGDSEADGTVPVDPQAIKVTPLVKDLKVTVGRENGTTKADASGTLGVDLKAAVPLPGGASADATGSLRLSPAVHFAYRGAGVSGPRTASIGFDLNAEAKWKLTGELGRATGPIRLPFAKLQASPVLTVAGLPVVVNLGLTAYLEVSADGTVRVEAEQEYSGTWTVHADYTGGRGWGPVSDAGSTKVSPLTTRLSGKAQVRTALGAEVSVGLYDTVGVEATVAPYLRGQVDGEFTADTSGNPPKVKGSWALFGGVDLTGALTAHLKVFGTPIIEGKLPLPVFHREWALLTGSRP